MLQIRHVVFKGRDSLEHSLLFCFQRSIGVLRYLLVGKGCADDKFKLAPYICQSGKGELVRSGFVRGHPERELSVFEGAGESVGAEGEGEGGEEWLLEHGGVIG
jgi:hypothetical protein